jgi:hypothetical protein
MAHQKKGKSARRAQASNPFSDPDASGLVAELQMRSPSEDLMINHETVTTFQLYRECNTEFSVDDEIEFLLSLSQPHGFSDEAPSLGVIVHPQAKRSFSQEVTEAVEKYGADSLAFNPASLEGDAEVDFIISSSFDGYNNDVNDVVMVQAMAVSESSAFAAPKPKARASAIAAAMDDGDVKWPQRGTTPLSLEDQSNLCKMLVERENLQQYVGLVPFLQGCCQAFSAPAFISSLRELCFSKAEKAPGAAWTKTDCTDLLENTVDYKELKRVTLDAKAQESPEYLLFSCLLACVEHALMPLVRTPEEGFSLAALKARINPVFRDHVADKYAKKTNVALPVSLEPAALEWHSVHRAACLFRLLASLLYPANRKTSFLKAIAALAGCPSKRYTPGGQPSDHTLRFMVLYEVECAFAAGPNRSLKAVPRQVLSSTKAPAAAATPSSPRAKVLGAGAAAPFKLFAPGSVHGSGKGKGRGPSKVASGIKGRASASTSPRARAQLRQIQVEHQTEAYPGLQPMVVFPFTPAGSSHASHTSLAYDPALPVKNLSAHAAAAFAAAAAATAARSAVGVVGEPSSSRSMQSRARTARERRGETDKENSEGQGQTRPPLPKRRRPSPSAPAPAPAPGPQTSGSASFASIAASFPGSSAGIPPSSLSPASASASKSSDFWGWSSASDNCDLFEFLPMDLEPNEGEQGVSAFPPSQ